MHAFILAQAGEREWVRDGVAMGEENAVFVVTTDAGGVEGDGEVEDGGGGGAFGDEVAGEEEVVGLGIVGEFGEVMVQYARLAGRLAKLVDMYGFAVRILMGRRGRCLRSS